MLFARAQENTTILVTVVKGLKHLLESPLCELVTECYPISLLSRPSASQLLANVSCGWEKKNHSRRGGFCHLQ